MAGPTLRDFALAPHPQVRRAAGQEQAVDTEQTASDVGWSMYEHAWKFLEPLSMSWESQEIQFLTTYSRIPDMSWRLAGKVQPN